MAKKNTRVNLSPNIPQHVRNMMADDTTGYGWPDQGGNRDYFRARAGEGSYATKPRDNDGLWTQYRRTGYFPSYGPSQKGHKLRKGGAMCRCGGKIRKGGMMCKKCGGKISKYQDNAPYKAPTYDEYVKQWARKNQEMLDSPYGNIVSDPISWDYFHQLKAKDAAKSMDVIPVPYGGPVYDPELKERVVAPLMKGGRLSIYQTNNPQDKHVYTEKEWKDLGTAKAKGIVQGIKTKALKEDAYLKAEDPEYYSQITARPYEGKSFYELTPEETAKYREDYYFQGPQVGKYLTDKPAEGEYFNPEAAGYDANYKGPKPPPRYHVEGWYDDPEKVSRIESYFNVEPGTYKKQYDEWKKYQDSLGPNEVRLKEFNKGLDDPFQSQQATASYINYMYSPEYKQQLAKEMFGDSPVDQTALDKEFNHRLNKIKGVNTTVNPVSPYGYAAVGGFNKLEDTMDITNPKDPRLQGVTHHESTHATTENKYTSRFGQGYKDAYMRNLPPGAVKAIEEWNKNAAVPGSELRPIDPTNYNDVKGHLDVAAAFMPMGSKEYYTMPAENYAYISEAKHKMRMAGLDWKKATDDQIKEFIDPEFLKKSGHDFKAIKDYMNYTTDIDQGQSVRGYAKRGGFLPKKMGRSKLPTYQTNSGYAGIGEVMPVNTPYTGVNPKWTTVASTPEPTMQYDPTFQTGVSPVGYTATDTYKADAAPPDVVSKKDIDEWIAKEGTMTYQSGQKIENDIIIAANTLKEKAAQGVPGALGKLNVLQQTPEYQTTMQNRGFNDRMWQDDRGWYKRKIADPITTGIRYNVPGDIMRVGLIDPLLGGTTRTPSNIAAFYRDPNMNTGLTMAFDAMGFLPSSYGGKSVMNMAVGDVAGGVQRQMSNLIPTLKAPKPSVAFQQAAKAREFYKDRIKGFKEKIGAEGFGSQYMDQLEAQYPGVKDYFNNRKKKFLDKINNTKDITPEKWTEIAKEFRAINNPLNEMQSKLMNKSYIEQDLYAASEGGFLSKATSKLLNAAYDNINKKLKSKGGYEWFIKNGDKELNKIAAAIKREAPNSDYGIKSMLRNPGQVATNDWAGLGMQDQYDVLQSFIARLNRDLDNPEFVKKHLGKNRAFTSRQYQDLRNLIDNSSLNDLAKKDLTRLWNEGPGKKAAKIMVNPDEAYGVLPLSETPLPSVYRTPDEFALNKEQLKEFTDWEKAIGNNPNAMKIIESVMGKYNKHDPRISNLFYFPHNIQNPFGSGYDPNLFLGKAGNIPYTIGGREGNPFPFRPKKGWQHYTPRMNRMGGPLSSYQENRGYGGIGNYVQPEGGYQKGTIYSQPAADFSYGIQPVGATAKDKSASVGDKSNIKSSLDRLTAEQVAEKFIKEEGNLAAKKGRKKITNDPIIAVNKLSEKAAAGDAQAEFKLDRILSSDVYQTTAKNRGISDYIKPDERGLYKRKIADPVTEGIKDMFPGDLMRVGLIDPLFGGTTRTPSNIANFYRNPGVGTGLTMGMDALGFLPSSWGAKSGAMSLLPDFGSAVQRQMSTLAPVLKTPGVRKGVIDLRKTAPLKITRKYPKPKVEGIKKYKRTRTDAYLDDFEKRIKEYDVNMSDPARLDLLNRSISEGLEAMSKYVFTGDQQMKRIAKIRGMLKKKYDSGKFVRNLDHYFTTTSWPKMKAQTPDVGGHVPIEDLGQIFKAQKTGTGRTKFIDDAFEAGDYIPGQGSFNPQRYFMRSMPNEQNILQNPIFKNRTGGFLPRKPFRKKGKRKTIKPIGTGPYNIVPSIMM